jgi:hypothetical protein
MKVNENLTEALIVKFDAVSGEALWERHFSRPIANAWSFNYAFDVDTDSSGNAYVVGQSTLTDYGDCLVLKYSTSGELLWENAPLNISGSESSYAVDVDDNGFAYVAGYTWDGSYRLVSFRCKPSGEVDWIKNEAADSFGTCVALSQDGKIYAAGVGGLGTATPGIITIKYGSSVPVIDEYGSSVPVIDKPRPGSLYPGEILTITGQGFGDSQGDSQVHIGPKTITRVKLWSDTKIRVRIPRYSKKKCSWFKHGDGQYRRRTVWVTVGMEDSNTRRIKVMKPDVCE